MKRLLLISLICILVFSFTAIGLAKVHLTFWQYPFAPVGDKEPGWYEMEVIAEFEAMYPEVEIELILSPWEGGPQKVETLIAAGEAPDILYDAIVRTGTYMARDLLYSFDDILTAEEIAKFKPFAYNFLRNDRGELVIFPWSCGVDSGLYVNEKLAKKVGAYDLLPLDRPNRAWTPEEFKAFLVKCKPLIEEGIYPFGFPAGSEQGDNIVQCMMQQWGADLFNEDQTKCVINSPEAVAFLEWFVNLNDEGLMYPNPESVRGRELREAFFDNKLVVFLGGLSFVLKEEWTSKVTGKLMIWPVPEGREPRLRAAADGPVAFNNGDPEKGKYAKLFCKYWSSKDIMEVWGGTSATITDKVYDNEELNYALSLSKYGADIVGSRFPYYKEYRALLFPEMQALFTHLKTPAQALEDLEKAVNALVE